MSEDLIHTKNRPSLDEVRHFWDARPCNIRHSNAPVGTQLYFDESEKRRYFVEPHIPEFAQFSRWKDKKVLEIGCGIGADAINFARQGAIYSGIELSQKSLDIAIQRFKIYNLQGDLRCVDGETLSHHFNSAHFDLIYSFGVIHHSPDPSKIIAEARKIIKPDGEIRLMLYAKNSWKAMMIEAGLDQAEAQSGVPIADIFDHDSATRLLEDNGFKVSSITQDHIFPYIIEEYIQYRYQLQPWFAAMPPEMFMMLKKQLGWHLLITAHPA